MFVGGSVELSVDIVNHFFMQVTHIEVFNWLFAVVLDIVWGVGS